MDAVSASVNTGVHTGSDVSLVISGIVEYVYVGLTTVVVTHFIPARTVDRQYFVSSAFCVLILELFSKLRKRSELPHFFEKFKGLV